MVVQQEIWPAIKSICQLFDECPIRVDQFVSGRSILHSHTSVSDRLIATDEEVLAIHEW